MAKDTLEQEKAQGSENATPPAQPEKTPASAEELAELRRKTEELSKQVSDKDSFISNLQSEKETLEARLNQTAAPQQQQAPEMQQEVTRILEKAQIDTEGASKDLANLIRNSNNATEKAVLEKVQSSLQPAIENNIYVADVKTKNKDLVDFFGERALSVEVQMLLEKGKQFKEAVDTVIKNHRQKYDSLKSNATIPPPAGSQGEEGGNQPPPTPPPPKELTMEEEIEARRRKKMAQGLA